MDTLTVKRTLPEQGSSMMKRIAEYRDKRNSYSEGNTGTLENLRLQDAFEAMGYGFNIQASGWRIVQGKEFSAHSESTVSNRALMLREALEAAGRHRWAQINERCEIPLKSGDKCMDTATGLKGFVSDVRMPYAEFISEPFTADNPAWFLRDSGAMEGDTVMLSRACRNLVSLEGWHEDTPAVTWSAVAAVTSKENIRQPETASDEVISLP